MKFKRFSLNRKLFQNLECYDLSEKSASKVVKLDIVILGAKASAIFVTPLKLELFLKNVKG